VTSSRKNLNIFPLFVYEKIIPIKERDWGVIAKILLVSNHKTELIFILFIFAAALRNKK